MVAPERDEDDMTRKTTTKTKPEAAALKAKAKSKIETLVDLLKQPAGATLESMMAATGWQAHSVRGAISGSLKKKLGLEVASEKVDGVRTYRTAQDAAA